ncbi:hypothetical protein NUSPORA_02962 [Nucleospora cyclopteri]
MKNSNKNVKKSINNNLEAIMDEYLEILQCFKKTTGKKEELECLVFSKVKTISICNRVNDIFKDLTVLKYNSK